MPEETSSSPAPESVEQTNAPVEPANPIEQLEAEGDASGGFREPHPEMPADFASHEADPEDAVEAAEPPVQDAAAEISPAAEPEPEPARVPEPPRESRREPKPERRQESSRRKEWTKPADFRPAASTAITQAVEHATFIAEALKELHDQMDEILELVEVAERQKLADEREIEELRRALRRIQPQRQQSSHHHNPPSSQRQQSRREEPRRQAPEPREPAEKRQPSEPSPKEPTASAAAAESERPAQSKASAAPSPASEDARPPKSSSSPAHEDEELPPHSD